MSEAAETFDAFRDISKAKRAANRQSSAGLLRAHGFEFHSRNAGAHLIVETPRGRVDFWPGTGLWCPKGTTRTGRGVFGLIAWAQREGPTK